MSKPAPGLDKKDPLWRERIVLIVGWAIVVFAAVVIACAIFVR